MDDKGSGASRKDQIRSFLRRNRIPFFLIAVYLPAAFFVSGTTCLLKSTIGLPCPGCGLTRAVLLALQGDFSAAFHAHPLFPLAILVLAVVPAVLLVRPRLLNTRASFIAGLVILILFVLVYIIRMIQGFPDTPPMDYNADSLMGRLFRLLFGSHVS